MHNEPVPVREVTYLKQVQQLPNIVGFEINRLPRKGQPPARSNAFRGNPH